MAKPTKKDAASEGAIVPSTGTHVVAVIVGDEVLGYIRNYGDVRKGWAEQSEARRGTAAGMESLAKMWSDSAKAEKKPERFEARLFEDVLEGAQA